MPELMVRETKEASGIIEDIEKVCKNLTKEDVGKFTNDLRNNFLSSWAPSENPKEQHYVVLRQKSETIEEGLHLYCGKCKQFGKPKELWQLDFYETDYSNKNKLTTGSNNEWLNIPGNNSISTASSTGNTLEYVGRLNKIECKHCETEVSSNETKHIFFGQDNIEFIWAGVFENDDKVKLKWIERKFTAYNEKIQVTMLHKFIVFNTLTGQTYEFETRDQNAKKVFKFEPRIKNITYEHEMVKIPYSIPQEIYKELADKIHSKISANLGYSPMTISEYIEQDFEFQNNKNSRIPTLSYMNKNIKLENIISYNRMPNINPSIYKKFIKNAFRWENESNKKIRNIIVSKLKNTESNPIGFLIDYYKLPSNKSLRKSVSQNLLNVYRYKTVSSLFKDVNNIRAIMESNFFEPEANHIARKNKADDFNKKSQKYKFVALLIEQYGETNATRKLCFKNEQGDFYQDYYLEDTAISYWQIQHIIENAKNDPDNNKNITEIKIDLNGHIKDMHDRFAKMYKKLSTKNHALTYDEEEKKVESEIDDFKFTLAEDTFRLIDIGEDMSICVGTYDKRALNKSCNIVYMHKDDKYIACIEMSGDMKAIVQAKAACNKKHSNAELVAMLKWAKENKLSIKTHDLPRPEEVDDIIEKYEEYAINQTA